MSYRSDKCTSAELSTFKDTVNNWLSEHGVDTEALDIRAFNCYGGDVRIYVGEYMDVPNTRSSFRRTDVVRDEAGAIVGFNGLRGHHVTRKPSPIVINRLEWPEFQAAADPSVYNSYTEDNNRLMRLKNILWVAGKTDIPVTDEQFERAAQTEPRAALEYAAARLKTLKERK